MSCPAQPTPAGQVTTRVPCRDALGRDHELTILVRGNDIIIQTPPGEVAILDVSGIAGLAAAARNAEVLATEAKQHSGGKP